MKLPTEEEIRVAFRQGKNVLVSLVKSLVPVIAITGLNKCPNP